MFSYRLDENTELQLLEERHAEELFALTEANRQYLQQWLPWLDAVNEVEDTRGFINGALQQFAHNDGFQAGIWFQNKLVGIIGYHKIDWANRATSIGYWLAAAHQGRGLITSACRALISHAFNELRLTRIAILCATENHKSQAIPKRLGFKQEGIVRQTEWLYDHYVDHVVYGLLASEWPKADK